MFVLKFSFFFFHTIQTRERIIIFHMFFSSIMLSISSHYTASGFHEPKCKPQFSSGLIGIKLIGNKYWEQCDNNQKYREMTKICFIYSGTPIFPICLKTRSEANQRLGREKWRRHRKRQEESAEGIERRKQSSPIRSLKL